MPEALQDFLGRLKDEYDVLIRRADSQKILEEFQQETAGQPSFFVGRFS